MPPSVMWKELTAEDLRGKAQANAVVVLPVASMEQHGPHLPVGVDTILCEAVCRRAAEMVADALPVAVAPTLWCGMAEHHMAFGGTFTFDIPTYRAVLLNMLKSLDRHGFKRVLIVNGHGGNIHALNSFLADFARETSLRTYVVTYFEAAAAAIEPILQDQKGVRHACEAETSMMMALAPETVKAERLPEAFGMLNWSTRGVLQRFYPFKEMTASGVLGDARRASREKGEKLVAACAGAIADILRDRSMWA